MSTTLEKEARFFVPKPDLLFKKISLALALAATPEKEARSAFQKNKFSFSFSDTRKGSQISAFQKISFSFSFSDSGKGGQISTFESNKQGEQDRRQKRKPDSLH